MSAVHKPYIEHEHYAPIAHAIQQTLDEYLLPQDQPEQITYQTYPINMCDAEGFEVYATGKLPHDNGTIEIDFALARPCFGFTRDGQTDLFNLEEPPFSREDVRVEIDERKVPPLNPKASSSI